MVVPTRVFCVRLCYFAYAQYIRKVSKHNNTVTSVRVLGGVIGESVWLS